MDASSSSSSGPESFSLQMSEGYTEALNLPVSAPSNPENTWHSTQSSALATQQHYMLFSTPNEMSGYQRPQQIQQQSEQYSEQLSQPNYYQQQQQLPHLALERQQQQQQQIFPDLTTTTLPQQAVDVAIVRQPQIRPETFDDLTLSQSQPLMEPGVLTATSARADLVVAKRPLESSSESLSVVMESKKPRTDDTVMCAPEKTFSSGVDASYSVVSTQTTPSSESLFTSSVGISASPNTVDAAVGNSDPIVTNSQHDGDLISVTPSGMNEAEHLPTKVATSSTPLHPRKAVNSHYLLMGQRHLEEVDDTNDSTPHSIDPSARIWVTQYRSVVTKFVFTQHDIPIKTKTVVKKGDTTVVRKFCIDAKKYQEMEELDNFGNDRDTPTDGEMADVSESGSSHNSSKFLTPSNKITVSRPSFGNGISTIPGEIGFETQSQVPSPSGHPKNKVYESTRKTAIIKSWNKRRSDTNNNDNLKSSSSPTSSSSLESSIDEKRLVPGLSVFARWDDDFYYPGRIVRMSQTQYECKYHIDFDDGAKKQVTRADIIRVADLSPGQSILVDDGKRNGNEIIYDQGIIQSQCVIDGDSGYQIELDSGRIIRVPKGKVCLSKDQAEAFYLLDEPSKPSISTVSLENIVTGKRSRARSFNKVLDSSDTVLSTDLSSASESHKGLDTETVTTRRKAAASQQRNGVQVFEDAGFLLTDRTRGAWETDSGDSDRDNPEYNKEELKQLICEYGGEIFDHVPDAVKSTKKIYLLARSHMKTFKYVLCLAAGVPCLNYMVIYHAIKQSDFHGIWPQYRLPAGFSTTNRQVVEVRSPFSPVFADKTVAVIASDPKFCETWKSIVEMAGAQVLTKLPPKCTAPLRTRQKAIPFLVTKPDCPNAVLARAQQLGIKPVSSEFVVQCIINQSILDPDMDDSFKYTDDRNH